MDYIIAKNREKMINFLLFNRVTTWLIYSNTRKINCNICGGDKSSGKSFYIDWDINKTYKTPNYTYDICDICCDTINFIKEKYRQECIKKFFLIKEIVKYHIDLDLSTLFGLYIDIYKQAFITSVEPKFIKL